MLFYDYKDKGIPLVVRGLLDDEVKSGQWEPKYVAAKFGDHKVGSTTHPESSSSRTLPQTSMS